MASLAALIDTLAERIVVLDGATATQLQGQFDHAQPVDRLCLTAPERIAHLHRAYLEAGAEILSTNSFNAAGLPDGEEIARAAAGLARAEVDRASGLRWVAGVLGPTPKSASLAIEGYTTDFDTLHAGYRAAARGLLAGGADLLLIETVFDAVNAKAAIHAARELDDAVPLLISATVTDASGRLLTGQDLEAFWIAVAHAAPLAVGLNCAFGAEALRPHLQTLARAAADVPIVVYPNAGLPDAFGRYGDGPETMAHALAGFAEEGLVNIVGGCCGTTPAHIAAIASAVKRWAPRVRSAAQHRARLSGLGPLALDRGMVIAGERTSVSGSARFGRAIRDGDMPAALAVARAQVEAGAQMVDLALDEALLDGRAAAGTFLRAFQAEADLARVPVMIDSAQWPVVEAALKTLQGKGLVNSISLKDGEQAFLAQARDIRRLGAAVVVMAFDENGQADTFARMTAICARAYRVLTEDGFAAEDIFFDPNLLPIATGLAGTERAASDFLEALGWIKRALPGAGTIAGVSAVSFAFRGNAALRAAIHAVFLHHARAQKLDIAILNAGELTVEAELPPDVRESVEDALFDRRPDAAERLLALSLAARPTATPKAEWRDGPVETRLMHALVQGRDDFIEADVEEARAGAARALDVIEGPLMAGMAEVGRLFGEGRLFLPQMIRSAKVMSRAVALLTPHLAREGGALRPRATLVLATVRGDVHDIGKSIVAAVLRAANYAVVDLGVMVPAEKIVAAVRAERADLVGLSALITPSLEEMAHVAAELEHAGLRVPLMIGGAATTATHTAVRIAPECGAAVAHVRDAAEALGIAAALLRGDDFEREQERLRARFAERLANTKLLPLAEARARAFVLDPAGVAPPPGRLGVQSSREDLAPLVSLIDWLPFYRAWGVAPESAEARTLRREADAMLARIVAENWIEARAAVGLFAARRDGDDIVVGDHRLPMLRQQMAKTAGRPNLCLADFVAPAGDHIGVFAVTAGLGVEARVAAFEADGDTHSAILLRALADRLAEALAGRLHARVREELWRFPAEGIRPAPGYPACPDHGLKATLFDLLGETSDGMSLSETYALSPAASIAGFVLAHPAAHYFGIGRIGRDQVADYAKRAGLTPADAERRLAPLLGYRP